MPARYRLAAAMAVLLASAMPASADWETTQWGMSPDEALAALDGASRHDPAPAEIYEEAGRDYAPLVKLPLVVEGISGEASLLFDTDDKLHFVLFNPADLADCAALSAALTQLYGPADAIGAGSMSISDWVGDGNAVKLTDYADAGICNLSYSAG